MLSARRKRDELKFIPESVELLILVVGEHERTERFIVAVVADLRMKARA
jgi:hypothetical protein